MQGSRRRFLEVEGAAGDFLQGPDALGEGSVEAGPLVDEVLVESGAGDTGAGDDVGDRGPRISLLGARSRSLRRQCACAGPERLNRLGASARGRCGRSRNSPVFASNELFHAGSLMARRSRRAIFYLLPPLLAATASRGLLLLEVRQLAGVVELVAQRVDHRAGHQREAEHVEPEQGDEDEAERWSRSARGWRRWRGRSGRASWRGRRRSSRRAAPGQTARQGMWPFRHRPEDHAADPEGDQQGGAEQQDACRSP